MGVPARSSIRTYDDALDYLSGLLKFGIKFGLDRFRELCRRVGDPQKALKVVHVTGTNGKGSTCVFVSSILRSAGYTVGTYLSPYVYDVRERIQINGEMISKEEFTELMSELAPHLEAVAPTDFGQGTEFEAKTLMAFLHFARKNVDYAVIEVGMGGRYDATNLVHPLVSVITNVSLDHTERLGDSISKIAWDKAGIAKPGTPLVTAADSQEAWQSIYSTAREQGVESIWRVLPKDFTPLPASPSADTVVRYGVSENKVTIELPEGTIGPIQPGLYGDFQRTNAATAAAAVAALRTTGHASEATDHVISAGIEQAYLPARLEVLRIKPTVIIDAAHNPGAAKSLAESIRQIPHKRLILVVGMLSTHSIEGFLAPLAPLADEIIATSFDWMTARPASEIAHAAYGFVPNIRIAETVRAAASTALESAAEDDLVIITGSFHTIGEVDREALANWNPVSPL